MDSLTKNGSNIGYSKQSDFGIAHDASYPAKSVAPVAFCGHRVSVTPQVVTRMGGVGAGFSPLEVSRAISSQQYGPLHGPFHGPLPVSSDRQPSPSRSPYRVAEHDVRQSLFNHTDLPYFSGNRPGELLPAQSPYGFMPAAVVQSTQLLSQGRPVSLAMAWRPPLNPGVVEALPYSPMAPVFPSYQWVRGEVNTPLLGTEPHGVRLNKGIHKRPSDTYCKLIMDAILSQPTKQATSCQIFKYISDRHPYFNETNEKTWRNCIRHTLSVVDAFKKSEVKPEGARGFFWTVDENAPLSAKKRSKKHRRS